VVGHGFRRAALGKQERSMSQNRESRPHVLLLTGTPGVGKTTVIRRAVAGLGAQELRGFYTEEIREQGERCGFRLVSFDGAARIIAHVHFPKTCRVGKYGVDVGALDDAAALLRPDPQARVFLVDEIGKMECLSERFVEAMRALISGRLPIVATVGARGGGFIAEVKRRPECELWHVTHANRDGLPGEILAWLAGRT
jgi:nucleoside-triphosphatase